MKLNKTSLVSLMLFTFATHAAPLPLTYYFKDSDSANISLDEPATGCVMTGILVHPVNKPETKVIWFNKKHAVINSMKLALSVMKLKPLITSFIKVKQ